MANTAYQQAVLDSGPYLFWKFDEASGDFLSEGSYSASWTSFSPSASVTRQVAGGYSGAQAVRVPAGTRLLGGDRTNGRVQGQDGWSFEAWFRRVDTTESINSFFVSSSSVSGAFKLSTSYFQARAYYGTGTAGVTLSPSWRPVAGQWYHLAFVNEETGDLKLYVDGQLQETVTDNNTPKNLFPDGTTPINLGATDSSAGDVEFHDLALFDRVLTASEVSGHYSPSASIDHSATPMTATATADGHTGVGRTPVTVSAGVMTASADMADPDPTFGTLVTQAPDAQREVRTNDSVNYESPTWTSLGRLGDDGSRFYHRLFRLDSWDPGDITSVELVINPGEHTGTNIRINARLRSIDTPWATTDASPPDVLTETGDYASAVYDLESISKVIRIDITALWQSWGGARANNGFALIVDANEAQSGYMSSVLDSRFEIALNYQEGIYPAEIIGYPGTASAAMVDPSLTLGVSVDNEETPATATADAVNPNVSVEFFPNWTAVVGTLEGTANFPAPAVLAVKNVAETALPATATAASVMPGFTNDTDVLISPSPATASAGGPYTDYSEADDPYVQFLNEHIDWHYRMPLNERSGSPSVYNQQGRRSASTGAEPVAGYFLNDPTIGLRDENHQGRRYVSLDGGLLQAIGFPHTSEDVAVTGKARLRGPDLHERTTAFVIRTTAQNTRLGSGIIQNQGSGSIEIVDGRLAWMQSGSSTDSQRIGRQFISDGEWHYIVIHHDREYRSVNDNVNRTTTYVMVDGEVDIIRYSDYGINITEIAPSAGATVDVAEFWIAANWGYPTDNSGTNVDRYNTLAKAELVNLSPDQILQRLYYTWINSHVITVDRMDAVAAAPAATGEGNRLRALMLSFHPDDDNPISYIFGDGSLAAPATSYHDEDMYYFSQIDIGDSWGDYYAEHVSAVGYMDMYDLSERYIDLRSDVDLSSYDLIVWRDGQARTNMEQRKRFEDMTRWAVEAATEHSVPMVVTYPHMASAMGIVKRYDYQRLGQSQMGSQFAVDMLEDPNVPIPFAYQTGTDVSTNDPGRFVQEHHMSRLRVLSNMPGFTDLQDTVRYSWENAFYYFKDVGSMAYFSAYRLEDYPDGRPWLIGDIVRFRNVAYRTTDIRDHYMYIWGAVPGEHMGQAIFEIDLRDKVSPEPDYNNQGENINPVHPLIFVMEGTSVMGHTLSAPIVVAHVPLEEDTADPWWEPRGIVVNNVTPYAELVEGREDDEKETEEAYEFWDFSGGRDTFASDVRVKIDPITGAEDTSMDIRPKITAEREKIGEYNGLQRRLHHWLQSLVDRDGVSTVRPASMEITADAPEPTVTVQRNTVIGVEPMIAQATQPAPAEADQSDNVVLVLPMRATAAIVGVGKSVSGAPMMATATMPSPLVESEGRGILMRLDSPQITMRVRY